MAGLFYVSTLDELTAISARSFILLRRRAFIILAIAALIFLHLAHTHGVIFFCTWVCRCVTKGPFPMRCILFVQSYFFIVVHMLSFVKGYKKHTILNRLCYQY